MESPLSVFFRMHWDHEPETRKPFRIKASVFRFMGSAGVRASPFDGKIRTRLPTSGHRLVPAPERRRLVTRILEGGTPVA